MIACLGVAAAEALSISFQVTGVPVAHELIALFPYVTTVAVSRNMPGFRSGSQLLTARGICDDAITGTPAGSGSSPCSSAA